MMLRKFISYNKMVIERGYSYCGIPGMGLVIASVLQKHLLSAISLWILYPLGMFIVWSIGLVDVRSKLYETETEIKTYHNPVMRETHKQYWKRKR